MFRSPISNLRKAVAEMSSPKERILNEQFAFGAREALSHALKLHPKSLFLGPIQHGWIDDKFHLSRPKILNNRGRVFTDFVWSERAQIELRKVGRRSVTQLGSPFAHLAVAANIQDTSPEVDVSKKEPLVTYFPNHSHHGWEAGFDTSLHFLKSFSRNTVVCLYWLDFINSDIRDHILNSGHNVACSGFRGSSGYEIPWANIGGRVNFLLNLYALIDKSDVVICDEVSSTFWYALSLGKSTMVLKKNTQYKTWNTSDLRHPVTHIKDSEAILRNFAIPYSFDMTLLNTRGELTALARRELGWEIALNPSELNLKLGTHYIIDDRLPARYVESFSQKFDALFSKKKL
jgi:hypothetical protein